MSDHKALPERVNYPFAVVWSTESAAYRRATVTERADMVKAREQVARDTAEWKKDSKPDAADKTWANYQEFVSMISRSPHGLKRSRFGANTSQRTRHAAVDTLLSVVPRGYGKRDGVIEW